MRYAVLFGPPNAGKSTLFNQLTGGQSKIVNYPGSTVDTAVATLKNHQSLTLIDVPGVQSFMPKSEDEKLTLKAITKLDALVPGAHAIPDLVVCVIDATQAERHLAMTKRLIDDGYPVIVVITMIDEAKKQGITIDHIELANRLGVSVFQVNGRKPTSITDIIDGVVFNSVPCGRLTRPQPSGLDDMLHAYEWAKQVLNDCMTVTPVKPRFDLDRWLLHPIFGYLVFIGLMVLFFSSIFIAANPFIDAIDGAFGWLGGVVESKMNDSIWRNFIVNGLIAGIGGVLVFVPQISFLFFGIGCMEATGYLARSAVLIDRPLSKIGLNGRSFVPLLAGCACAIPAIMATRTIANRRVRFLTMLAVPLMQCSARLPVYGLLLGALFVSPIAGAIGLTSIYIGSIILAAVIVGIANRSSAIVHDEPDHFIMQLPTWRWPVWSQLFADVIRRTKSFVVGAGPIIVGISIVLWALAEIQWSGQPLIYTFGQWIEPIFSPMGVDWRVGVALILSFAAREVFVSALLVVFQLSESAIVNLATLPELTHATTQQPLFTTGSMVGLILFFMVAMQCGATYAVLKKEMGNLRWPTIILVGYIVLAYALAVLANGLF